MVLGVSVSFAAFVVTAVAVQEGRHDVMDASARRCTGDRSLIHQRLA